MTDYRQIVWIASYPKSGNTWVRTLIDAYYLGEVDINEMVCSVADDNSYHYNIGDGSDIREAPVDIQMLARPMAMLRLVRVYLDNKVEGLPLFVKTHNAHLVANGVELLPEALTKATVCIVRDPRDVLPSFAKHMGLSIEDALTAMNDKHRVLFACKEFAKCAEFISSWELSVNSYNGADTHNVLMVKYEDLKADTVGEFAKILKHAGIEPDMDRVKRAVEVCNIKNLKKQEEKDGFKEASPTASFFGGERDKPTDIQLFRVKKIFNRAMKRLGYIGRKRA